MSDIGSGLITFGPVQVTVAGTRVKLAQLGTFTDGAEASSNTVTIQALSTNTGKIAVGDENVVAAVGTQVTPTTVGVLLSAGDTISFDINDTADIWIDATVSKDGISGVALTA
jgi:hypothetical protein